MNLKQTLSKVGINPRVTLNSSMGLAQYLSDKRAFLHQAAQSKNEFRIAPSDPYLSDRKDAGGTASGQYFHQDLVVAQQIWQSNPKSHVDVGSRVDGFVAHVAAFRQIEVHDIRPLRTSARNINFVQRDATKPNLRYEAYTDSLSCLHTLEHFGLGRYGDEIGYYGYRDGLLGLSNMLQEGGILYLSVPVSRDQRIEFNAHRIFALPYLMELTRSFQLHLETLYIVDDNGELRIGAQEDQIGVKHTFDLHHGCAILTLRKSVGG